MKMILKAILNLLFISGCYGAFAQGAMIVHDPTSFITLGDMLVQAENQASLLTDQYQVVKESADRIEKVSNVIKSLQLVEEIMREGLTVINQTQTIYNTLGNIKSLSPTYLANCTKRCTYATKRVMNSMDFLKKTISGDLKMSDSERLNVLENALDDINETATDIGQVEQEIKQIQRMANLFNNF